MAIFGIGESILNGAIMDSGLNLTNIFPTLTALVGSIDKLTTTYDKLRELEEKKENGTLKPGEEKKLEHMEAQKKMQLFSMGALLINQLMHLANTIQNSSTWQQMQTKPAERTVEVVEAAASAGRILSREEIADLHKREVMRGQQMQGAMLDAEKITGLAPDSWYQFKRDMSHDVLWGLRMIKDLTDWQGLHGNIPGASGQR